ncbi:PD-(D/E)XK motif protein [Paenibacillus sp. JNUCC32]|uniref:PD-(D/E)XK motif protein n=1 Tax=Paenibacillus sp. JNUCC32 TaxID=2777984 RepID=UPI0017887920|nr:PD-(D/E)XK motif protein [Paenibacillus sp. JNUCC-32]QOT08460.1 PD-(D/E)XK motif protein [Paenibacillus sp. JNUCC-32]
MLNLKLEYEQMINEIKDQSQQEVYKLRVLTAENPIIFAGVDTASMTRQLYIDLGFESWETDQVKALPKWRGLSIQIEYYEKLALLRGHYFLVLRQEAECGTEIFEVVLQNVVDHLLLREQNESIFSVIYKVLDRWRVFFQKGGYRKLTEEQQRGLFGELWYIDDWLNRFPTSPPLIIEQWEGPTSGRIDFKHSKRGVEIKTAINKLNKTIKISNENQLRLTNAVTSIYLYVCFIELSKTHGISLYSLVNKVRKKIESRSDRMLLKFNDLLEDLRFKEDDYTDDFFFVDKVEAYEAAANFPRILQEDLPKGISHVSYCIDLTHCTDFEREVDEVFDL